MTLTNRSLRSFPAWKALEAHYSTVHELHLRQLFAEDPKRGECFTLEAAGLYLDYSRDMGHYVENTGDEPLVFLSLFRSDHYADISLAQWMGVLPPELVKAHRNVDDTFIVNLPKSEPLVR
jgi:hypothetical protein